MPRAHAISSIAVAVLLTSACTACTSLTSTTRIDPGMSFLLGGGQTGAFVVRGTNSGSVPVIVYVARDGRRDSVGTIPPRGEIDAEFASRAMAVFRNPSTSSAAEVSIRVTGATSSLGMGYERGVTPKP